MDKISNVNKALYGPAALIVAQMVINWLRLRGFEIDEQMANLVISPIVVGLVVWAVPNGIGLFEYLHRIAQKVLGQLEKEIDDEIAERKNQP